MIPQIVGPTRLNDKGKYTLIDNIFYNDVSQINTSGNLLCPVTDHLPNFLQIPIESENSKQDKHFKRDYSNYNPELLKQEIKTLQLETNLLNLTTVNEKYNLLHDNLQKLINKHVPLKETKRPKRNPKKPWISDKIITMITKKHKIWRKYFKHKNIEILKQYRIMRNKINHEIRKRKFLYYNNFFNQNKNNLKKQWHAINLLINKKRSNQSPTCILKGGTTTRDPDEIAKIINKYYVNVAPELVKKLPRKKSKLSYRDYLKPPFLTPNPTNSFYCRQTTKEEVSKIIESLDSNKTEDIYKFPIQLIKDLKDEISGPLVSIINSSLNDGIFPEKLKFAKVIPLFKGGDPTFPKNYRPISVLPIFDKILEKLMYTRLMSFITKNGILNNAQYGFQKRKSTSHAILDMLENISQSLLKKSFSCCLFLDLAKAFDTVNHSTTFKIRTLWDSRNTE